MPDVFTKAKRSEVMSRIRSRGNRDTELALASLFRRHGITGWRRHIEVRVKMGSNSPRPSPQRGEGGNFRVRPDFVFPKLRLAVFVDGCFWHACPKHATEPKNNRAFWRKKLAANKVRDRKVNRALRAARWRVLRIWEHELRRSRKRKTESGTKTQRNSTPHPSPLPVRGGEGEARLVAKLRKALPHPPCGDLSQPRSCFR